MELKDNPLGKLGEMLKTNVPYPPEAITGVNAVAVTFWVNDETDWDKVVLNAGNAFTVNVNVLLLLWGTLFESVTVTV